MQRNLWIATLFAAGSACWACQPQSDASRTHPGDVTVLLGPTLIDGTGAPPVQNAAVVVKDGRILAAGGRGQVEMPTNAHSIDLAGKWLMPGMADAHMHFSESGGLFSRPDVYDLRERVPFEREVAWMRERLPYTLSRYLCAGVTSVLALSGPREHLKVRDTATKLTTAPRVAVGGPFMANIPFGEFHSWMREDPAVVQLKTPEQARALVREQVARKVDIVKVGFVNAPGYPLSRYLPILESVIDESHKLGVRVAVHAEELEAAKAAVRAGADVLAHTVNDQPVDDEFIQMVKDHGVIAVTSLGVRLGYARVLLPKEGTQLLEVERTCGDQEVIRSWSELSQIPADQRPPVPDWVRDYSNPEPRQLLLQNIKRMQDARVQIAVGSDGGNIGTLHGASYHRELELLAEAGIPPMDILIAATRNASVAVTGTPDRGTIQAGQLADLLILDADPLADIRNFSRIHAVMKGGTLLDHESLVASR